MTKQLVPRCLPSWEDCLLTIHSNVHCSQHELSTYQDNDSTYEDESVSSEGVITMDALHSANEATNFAHSYGHNVCSCWRLKSTHSKAQAAASVPWHSAGERHRLAHAAFPADRMTTEGY